jgi:hypothetical protein
MRILLLSHFCPPEPVECVIELGKSLQAAGYAATILTGFPKFPTGRI